MIDIAALQWSAPLVAQMTAAFALALTGGLHCAGMCGGVVSALHVERTSLAPATAAAGYHGGRLLSYGAGGATVGLVGASLYTAQILPLQIALLTVGSALLLVIGIALLGRTALLRRLEPAGGWLWRRVAPGLRRVYPPRTPVQALAAGLIWGWVPCGLVYAALPLALLAGGAVQGAAVMLAFGIGTLPAMLGVDLLARRLGTEVAVQPLKRARQQPRLRDHARAALRPAAGVLIVVFAVSNFAHAARVAGSRHPAVETLAALCHPLAPR